MTDPESLKRVMEDGFSKVDHRLQTLSEQLIDVLRGKDVVGKDLVKELLGQQAKSYQRILTVVTTLLSSVIVVILGLKQLAPHLLGTM